MKLVYKPLGTLTGVIGGLIAGVLFKRMWTLIGHDHDPPKATQENRSWSEVLSAAALEGAIYAGVKALLQRGGAVAFQRATGAWPGESAES